jgi:hypothetical protein
MGARIISVDLMPKALPGDGSFWEIIASAARQATAHPVQGLWHDLPLIPFTKKIDDLHPLNDGISHRELTFIPAPCAS